MSFRIFKIVIINISLALIDKISKAISFNFLEHQPDQIFTINRYCDLVSIWNYGISFGMFTQYQHYSNIIFLVINSFILIYLWYLLLKSTSKLSFVGFNLIVGGAIGNIIDRIDHGAVFDFIYIHYSQYGFAVFNLADSFISIGVVILILDYYFTQKHIEQKKDYIYNKADKKSK